MRAWYPPLDDEEPEGLDEIINEIVDSSVDSCTTLHYLFTEPFEGKDEVPPIPKAVRAMIQKWMSDEALEVIQIFSPGDTEYPKVCIRGIFSSSYRDKDYSLAVSRTTKHLHDMISPVYDHLAEQDTGGIEKKVSYEIQGEHHSGQVGDYTTEFVFSIDSDDDEELHVPVEFRALHVMEEVRPPGAEDDDGRRAPTNVFHVRLTKDEREKPTS